MFLHKMGYYPIVITRKWEKEINTYADVNQISTPGIQIEKTDWGEIHHLPYNGNLRDKIIAKYGMSRMGLMRKALSLWELLLENFFVFAIPYKNFLFYTTHLIKKEAVVGTIISSGPFPQFFLGYLLHQKTGIPWVADYRDDWSTDEVGKSAGFVSSFLKKINRRSEKKWVGSAAAFTTISPYYRDKIARLVQIPGFVIQNGFSKTEIVPNATTDNTLVYNGTLYPSQPVEDLLHQLKAYNTQSATKLTVDFPGLGIDPVQKNRVVSAAQALGVENYLNITPRIPKEQVMEKQQRALALIMFGHTGLKGIPSSKIYEYLSLGKPILLFEPDGDILEEIVLNYNLGFVVGKPLSFQEIIDKIKAGIPDPDISYVDSFSRENQVKELSLLMDTFFVSQ